MDNREEAIFAVLQGVPIPVMAKELGVTEATIYRWMKEGGHSKQIRDMRNREVIDDYVSSDLRIEEILDKHDIGNATLYKIIHDNNVPMRKPTRDEDRDAKVIEMYKAGVTVAGIVKAMSMSYNTLYDILEDHDIRTRRYSIRRGR